MSEEQLDALNVKAELPFGLRQAIDSGTCVLFLGSGIGRHMRDADGKHAPTGWELAEEIAQHFKIESSTELDLARAAQIVELRKGRPELEAFLRTKLGGLTPDDMLKWLFSFRWKAIYTTNYDDSIEKAYDLLSEPQQKPVSINITEDIKPIDPRFDVPIYHLHGKLSGGENPHIVITEKDYARFREKRRMLFDALRHDIATSNILYIGYSNRDPNWKLVHEELSAEFSAAKMPQSYRIDPSADIIDVEILEAQNIHTLKLTYEDFYKAGLTDLSAEKIDYSQISKARQGVPRDLLPAFDANPVPVLRLLSSWTYVNQEAFHATPNVNDFLKGDRPNWALVGSRKMFQRDIEDDVFDELLDYATDDKAYPKTCAVLGSAGYGMTTLLMTLAARLVADKAGPVFMLKPGQSVIEGDVQYAFSLLEGRPFFFVDDAADQLDCVKKTIHRLKETNSAAMFIFGERTNEWRQSRATVYSKEFEIDPLSAPEIDRLLACLSSNGALGELQHLSPEMRVAAIKQNYRNQLLVTMRQATEGKSFDAIIEDEFRGINSELGKRLYLAVCCFHQLGIFVRDSTLQDLLGIPLVDLYRQTADSTEGVVICEEVDGLRDGYVARARHRIIAQVVWERCGQPAEQDQLVTNALRVLNLTYRIDRIAFENLVRADRIIDQIESLDGRINFFEIAIQKEPENAYNLQHYARMLLRAGKETLALSQIDSAIEIDPQARVLYHTRGMILAQLAMSNESSRDVGRRRLLQGEDCYRQCLKMRPNDEYSYQGLARMFFDWARRDDVEADEAAEYLQKAEAVINEGLRSARIKDGLWVESSRIEDYLGNQPSRLKALERAVKASPNSIVPRYLLGRAYRRSKQANLAEETLKPIVEYHHDEFRSFLEYALTLIDLGKPYVEAIAIMNLSTLYGLADARYIATLGGLYYLNGDFTKANQIFSEVQNRRFTGSEINTAFFQPPDPTDKQSPLCLEGIIGVVKAGYALIDVDGYPRILCPASKFHGAIMEEKAKVKFQLGFSAKRPIAEKPKLI
ncbi:MAG: SIR2 family protein [Pontiellaceae bacterium]|nr:SIR2 family protein [Pontiellaceae bacterium]